MLFAVAELEVSDGEAELLIHALSDDVALVWALIELGIRGNPPASPKSPSAEDLALAFNSFERLVKAGLIRVGHMEYVDGGPPGRVAPVKHVSEPLDAVRKRVEVAVESAAEESDWAYSCWIVNTPAGDGLARRLLDSQE